ncbi:MAG: type II toxin-antitoxin system prevent-host-death family antitoxin, partial [Actinophytocola sp.]|nr:type II toxin-antitoxin system prevent-host-death family antitoxin [Actinophytocola sp.]
VLDEVEHTHEEVEITRHGHVSAVLVSKNALEELRETIEWLSKPGIRESVAEAEREYAAGTTLSGDELRTELGLPPQ